METIDGSSNGVLVPGDRFQDENSLSEPQEEPYPPNKVSELEAVRWMDILHGKRLVVSNQSRGIAAEPR